MLGTAPLAPSQGRDLRIDLCRALAIWFIFVDHSQGDILGYFTLARLTLADAAEALVLISGYSAGLVYGATLLQSGLLRATWSVLRRVGVLYISQITLIIAVVSVISFLHTSVGGVDSYLHEMRFDTTLAQVRDNPFSAFKQMLLLQVQPLFCDILPLYMVLFAILLLFLPILLRPCAVLSLSITLYAVAQAWNINLVVSDGSGWIFNPFAWQLLFFCGVVLGTRSRQFGPAWPNGWGMIAGCIVFLIAGTSLRFLLSHPRLLSELPSALNTIVSSLSLIIPTTPTSKTWLHPMRLLSILAVAYLLASAIGARSIWLRGPAASPLVLMGQNGLAVFCVSVPLSLLASVALMKSNSWVAQLAVNLLAFGTLVAVAAMRRKCSPGGRLDLGTSVRSRKLGVGTGAVSPARGSRTAGRISRPPAL